jgi:hypothetical protein
MVDQVYSVTSTSPGDLEVVYHVQHTIINVVVGSFNIQATLSVKLIDLDGDGTVFLRDFVEGEAPLLVPGVLEESLLFPEYLYLPLQTLGQDAILHGQFEISPELVPVEASSWGNVKAIYRQ